MTCSRRSTPWFASVLVALACSSAVAEAGARGQGQTAGVEEAARHAVVEAVRHRMGESADVQIAALRVGGIQQPWDGADFLASPEPGARLGRPVRFTLSQRAAKGLRPHPAGYVLATVSVVADHVRAGRALGLGETAAAEDLVESRADVGAVLMQPLPAAGDVAGARVLRDVMAGEVVTRSVVAVRPTVQSGQAVAVRARADGLLVQVQGVAEQSGELGETIRVVNRDSRRAIRARVVAPGIVEVIQ
jgi:flagella basal body P-ring formation protein FlgA